jgi:AcrR family transcriptional regulator
MNLQDSRPARKQDARFEKSRTAMREAMLGLLEEIPLRQVTGAMVAKRAGIGYATFFRHYDDVHALLLDTVTTLVDDLAARMMPALLAADTRGAAAALIDYVVERSGLCRALLAGSGADLRAMLLSHVVDHVAALPRLSPSLLPPRLAIRLAVAGTVEVLEWWLRDAPGSDPQTVAAILDRVVMTPLAAADDRPPAQRAVEKGAGTRKRSL